MAKKEASVQIAELTYKELEVYLVGTEPLYFNRKTEFVRRELLLPRKKKNRAEKEGSLKHDPVAEFRGSIYRIDDPKAPTLLGFPAPGFKGAIATAALDMKGATKTQVGRLIYVPSYYVPIYGIPKLCIDDVRMADMKRTPDIRTRARVDEWCCVLRLKYITPNLTQRDIGNLIVGAGLTVGIGDFRQEKGKGSFGLFRMVEPGNADWKRIAKAGGRAAQEEAMKAAAPQNEETYDLLAWLMSEAKERSLKITQQGSEA